MSGITAGLRRRDDRSAEVTSFVGRRREISELKRLLSEHRLVTLTGPGGVGKTRLALRVADEVRRAFHGRMWVVDLAELREPGLLAEAVAEQLRVHQGSAEPAVDTIIDRIAAEPVLLVLDNCEHLVDACATLASTLVRTCPELRILATSRQSLGLTGERTYQLRPFPVPDPDRVSSPASVTHFDSARLFVDRATAVLPHFTVDSGNYRALARLCHDLDGIPLAIELTVPQLRALTLEQLADRLGERHALPGGSRRGLPPRHRTLEALIDWSYQLCSEAERHVWVSASAFSATFDLAAIEHVAADDAVPRKDVLGLVDALVDKSIFLPERTTTGTRYRMLDTTRRYGEEKLAAAGRQDTVRHRHRDWFAHLAASFGGRWIGPEEPAWHARVHQDYPNLRSALDHCAHADGEAGIGLRMVVQLVDYWTLRGTLAEGRVWLDRLLDRVPGQSRERLAGLVLRAWFAVEEHDRTTARACLAEAVPLAGRVGTDEQVAYLVEVSGMAALLESDLGRAVELLGAAFERFRRAGILRGELFALGLYGLAAGLNGDPARGRELLDMCIDEAVRVGDVFWRSYALWARGCIDVHDDRFDSAERFCKEALRTALVLSDRSAMALAVEALAWVAEGRGRHDRAARLFGSAGALWAEISGSHVFYTALTGWHHDFLARTRAALGDSAYERSFQDASRQSIADAIDFALETAPRSAAQQRSRDRSGAEDQALTRREFQIAQLVAAGLTNRDIATRLEISQRTAEAHVQNILTKLGFRSRAQIATWVAAREGSHLLT
ncbi:ATP-binding protein [Saccharopolyspora thermophila]|uniref:LuxR family transcriptional regulator n=1 Tax=Saccharopolyspora thermophila TaxID=89367 RepID=A0ABN1D948_9PSEU